MNLRCSSKPSSDSERPFKFDANLDDEVDREAFLKVYEPGRGRALANRLGFRGKGCVAAANALMNYACNKRAAVMCRKRGAINTAVQYETICDRIYKEDIQPAIECW